ncbi:MAG TPA: translocation/assembly module TamB domain-containing protein, partial [Polyangiaceae bacterium]|nr:translocation/assembly module TamB domain-containing protein [Polyangiaceae bacterium]
STAGIDLGRVGRLAHLGNRLRDGKLVLDTDMTLRPGYGAGRLVLRAADVDAAGVPAISARADLTLDGRSIQGTLHADAGAVGALDVSVPKVTLGGGGSLGPRAWARAFGAVDVDARADLGRLGAVVPAEDLPFSEARGTVGLRAHLARDDLRDGTPAITVHLDTDKLALAPRSPLQRDIGGVPVHPAPRWSLDGVDVDLDGSLDGETGALRVSMGTRDRRGALARLDVASKKLPCADLFHDTDRWWADLQTADLDVHLRVPERGLGSLPALLEQHYVTGRVLADATLRGSLATPQVDVVAGVRHAGFGGRAGTQVMDIDVEAHYDGKVATGSAKARSEGRELLRVDTRLDGAPQQLLAHDLATGRWTASARAHLDSFPLNALAVFDERLLSGVVSGDVSLDGLHEDARLDAGLSVDRFSVGSIAYKSARVAMKAEGGAIDADVRIDQADGFGEAKAHATASWGARLAPELDPTQPLDAKMEAKSLRLAAVQPFVSGVLDELDGRLDGRLEAELDPRDRDAKLSGNLVLTRGAVEAAVGGGELHDIAATVKFEPNGTIALEKLDAAGVSGKLHAEGVAHLEGASLASAHATISIPGDSAIPLTAGGVELGALDGRIDVNVGPSRGASTVRVEVPKADVKLSESSTRTPQALGPFPDNVRIGVHRDAPWRFVLVPLDPSAKSEAASDAPGASRAVVATHLGEVHVSRGTELGVDLTGNVNVNAGGTTHATGQIRLKKGGKLDVQGRTFTIDSGTVTFVDDPGNPQVVVKAGWTAPDGTIVYATFAGPLKTGKVTLSSEPRLSKEEIVQVLLFGSAGGKQAQTPSTSTENSAIATAGGEAAQPLNHMLNQLGLGAVTAKVDTSESANPKPEVEVQVAKDISLQIAVVLGQPPPGVNPDRTLFTLDWRLFSKWSLATTVGDAGTTIFDLLWQRRY